jgi:hypothetical protein
MTPENIIAALRAKRRDVRCDDYDALIGQAIVALEQLSSPVLPEEVAEAIQDLGESCEPGGLLRERAARLLQRLAGELAEAKANERRNDMGLRAATNALNAAEGIRVDLERKLAARDSELAECKAQNRAMAETMSAFAKLDTGDTFGGRLTSAPEPARKAVCGTCGGSGETEEDATGALGYVVNKPCQECAT